MAQSRRFHVPALRTGELPLDPAQARHARGSLRLEEGAEVELFDEAGNVATGTLVYSEAHGAAVRVTEVRGLSPGDAAAFSWSVAAAVPKGERADWMVEKLSELGAAEFIPLITARSVVHPEGRGKRERWQRLATESAKQSRRAGVMRIAGLTRLEDAIAAAAPGTGWYLSTSADALPAPLAVSRVSSATPLTLFVGPEGGWTPQEVAALTDARLTPVRLTDTILRIETAAVAGAAIAAVLLSGRGRIHDG